jgi:hypothetical protein
VGAPTDATATTASDGDGLAKAGKRKNNGNSADLGFEAQNVCRPDPSGRALARLAHDSSAES